MLKKSFAKIKWFIEAISSAFTTQRTAQTAASLSYYFFLSLFPFLMFINVLVSFLNIDSNNIAVFLAPLLPRDALNIIIQYNNHAHTNNAAGIISMSVLFAVFSATGAMNSLISAINKAYGITAEVRGMRNYILSFIFTLGLGVAALLCIALLTFGETFLFYLALNSKIHPDFVGVIRIIIWLLIFFILFGCVSAIYFFIPDKKIKFISVLPGAVLSIIGCAVISYCFGIYIERFSNLSILYGSIGAFMAILLWFYLMGISITLGAQINCILEDRFIHKKRIGTANSS